MQIDFYFDYTSPYSYLAHTQLGQLEQWGAQVNLKPIFLGGIISSLGSVPPFRQGGAMRVPYMLKDLERWAELYNVPLNFTPFFPANTLAMLRATPYVQAQGRMHAFMKACFNAVWVDGLNSSEEEVVKQMGEACGMSGEAVWQAANAPENKAWLKEATNEAIERGVFGVPTVFLGDEMYFGNDRLLFVNRHLAGHAHKTEMDRLRGE